MSNDFIEAADLKTLGEIAEYTPGAINVGARNIFNKYYFINNYQTLFYGNVIGDPANFALSVRRQFKMVGGRALEPRKSRSAFLFAKQLNSSIVIDVEQPSAPPISLESS